MNARASAPAVWVVNRLTVGANDALLAAGNVVSVIPGAFEVVWLAPVDGLVMCLAGEQRCAALRLATEAPFRHEHESVSLGGVQ